MKTSRLLEQWFQAALASAVIAGVAVANMAATHAQNVMTEDLGDPNWEENPDGVFINTNLIQQDGDVIVFDSFTDEDVYYVRFEGNCRDMTVKELRLGSFVEQSVVSFLDVTDDPDRPVYEPEGLTLWTLEAACLYREG